MFSEASVSHSVHGGGGAVGYLGTMFLLGGGYTTLEVETVFREYLLSSIFQLAQSIPLRQRQKLWDLIFNFPYVFEMN